jgi:quercetin dioxygenase-like cupin family protein
MSRSRLVAIAIVSWLATAQAGPSDDPKLVSATVAWDEIQGRPSPNGRTRSILRGPTATLEELESHVTTLPPGQASHAPHRHPQEEVIILREGMLDVFQNGRTRRVGTGAFLFMASMEEHAVKNVGEGPAVYYVVQWKVPAARTATAQAERAPSAGLRGRAAGRGASDSAARSATQRTR